MQQLGSLTQLRGTISIEVYREDYPGTSPFLQFSLDPLQGLPQLAELQQLRQLIIAGVVHTIRQSEVEWMVVYRPWLQSIESPILNEYD